jgi:hypothetical protein
VDQKRAWLAILLLVIVAGMLVGLAYARRGSSGQSDAAKNERILQHLVPPAGARVSSKTTGPSYESTSDISQRQVGYATDVEYEVPKGAQPRGIAEAYAKQLRGWKRHEEVIPCEQVDAGDVPNPCQDIIADVFKKGDVEVSLNLDSFDGPPPWGYELTILQRSAGGR